MRPDFLKAIACSSVFLCLTSLAATPAPPKADLTVELRQVKEGQEDQDSPQPSGGAYIVGTAPRAVDFAPQQVRVSNGEKASLHINQSMPMQWVQKIEAQAATLSATSASASVSANSQSGGLTQAVTWMEAGQSLSVTPLWPGGKQAARVEIEVQSSAVDERTGSELPNTARQHLATTVSAPLGRWVTIATTGKAARPGSYSSAGSSDGRRLMQIRVTAD